MGNITYTIPYAALQCTKRALSLHVRFLNIFLCTTEQKSAHDQKRGSQSFGSVYADTKMFNFCGALNVVQVQFNMNISKMTFGGCMNRTDSVNNVVFCGFSQGLKTSAVLL